jgi:hypothetical protein
MQTKAMNSNKALIIFFYECLEKELHVFSFFC